MKIIETSIPDISVDVDVSKIDLADKIIGNIHPLLDDIYNEKVSRISLLEKELSTKKRMIQDQKVRLESLFKEYKLKQKRKKLLDRIDKLVSSGLAGTTKNETVILLKIIDKLPDDKLDFHLKNTMKLISSRFST